MIYKLLLMNLAVLLIPGVNFYMVLRNTLRYGHFFGVSTALGVSFAIVIHASIALMGAKFLKETFPMVVPFMKIGGAIFIVVFTCFLFFQALRSRGDGPNIQSIEKIPLTSFLRGFSMNFLNPYVLLFFLSTFSYLGLYNQIRSVQFLILALILFLNFFWFFLVSFLFSRERLRGFFW